VVSDPWGERGAQPPAFGRGGFGPGPGHEPWQGHPGRQRTEPGVGYPTGANSALGAIGASGRAGRTIGRDGPVPKHLSPTQQAPVTHGRQMPTRRRGLNWLIAIPSVLTLLVPLYNRETPRLFGLPFFYWYQLACVLLMAIVVTFVYVVTRGRRPRWTR
jgi:hypothetical protein